MSKAKGKTPGLSDASLKAESLPLFPPRQRLPYSTVTDLAKFLGLSTSVPLAQAV